MTKDRTEYFKQWNKDNKEKKRQWYLDNKNHCDNINRKWAVDNPERSAFLQQRSGAKTRGIEFLLTFEEWITWWGSDFNKRGKGKDKFCMCRTNDEGAYELGNIYKDTCVQNARDFWR